MATFACCRLASWLRSVFCSTIAGSRKSKVWVANDRSSGKRKKLSTWDEPLARAPHRWLLPRTRQRQPACERLLGRASWSHFPFPISPSMSHVASHDRVTVKQALAALAGSPEVHQRLHMRVRYIGLPLAAVVLPNPPDISPSLFHPALFCCACPDFRFHQDHHTSSVDPAAWPLCPLPVSKSSLGRTPTMAPG